MRTLADLIAFNNAHCPQELVYYDQTCSCSRNSSSVTRTTELHRARSHATNTAAPELMEQSLAIILTRSLRHI